MHILSWSGGKDSTASVILAHEHNLPLDVILFSEVMFDKERNISGENLQHIDFIKNKAKPLFESWGYKVEILHSDKDYLDVFNHVMKRAKDKSHIGKKYGFAISGLCSVKRDCKMKPIEKYLKSIKEPIIQYIGIAVDEPKRLESMHKNNTYVSLLEQYGYTEKMAKDLCIQYGLLSPTYSLSKRGGCWFCPNSKLQEHEEIRNIMPDVWNQFVALEDQKENLANDYWNIYTKQTLRQRDEYLRTCGKQMTIFDFLKN